MKGRGYRRKLTGTVISNKMDKTVVVSVERLVKHPLYRKHIHLRKKLAAHDAQEQCTVGDVVQIISTRPLSKTKRWAVTKVVKHSSPPSTQ
jgi:small subunit ribosomal protein S17